MVDYGFSEHGNKLKNKLWSREHFAFKLGKQGTFYKLAHILREYAETSTKYMGKDCYL